MTKVIIIDKCRYCFYCKRMLDGLFKKTLHYFCLNSSTTYTLDPNSQPRELTDLETIPEWCKLKEAIPNLENLQYEYNKNLMLKKYRKEHKITESE